MIEKKNQPVSAIEARVKSNFTLSCILDNRVNLKSTKQNNYLIPSVTKFKEFFRITIQTLEGMGKLKKLSENKRIKFNLDIQIVDDKTSQEINNSLRGKNNSTNIISVDYGVNEVIDSVVMGDLIYCLPVINGEMSKLNILSSKDTMGYWAHLSVHGLLHILGFEHDSDESESEMQYIELECLRGCKFEDLYMQKF